MIPKSVRPRRGLRRGPHRFVAAAMVLLFLPMGQVLAQGGPPPPAKDATAGGAVAAVPIDDSVIENRLRQIFRNIDQLDRLSIAVDAGVVRLTGTLESEKKRAEAVSLAKRVEGVVDVRAQIGVRTSVLVQVRTVFERLETRAAEALIYIPLFFASLFAFLVFWVAARWIADREAWYRRFSSNPFLRQILSQAVRIAIVVLGLIVALEILDATSLIGAVLGAAGLTGLALGFALKETVENYIAGILLSVRQPFAPHDHILVEGQEGQVVRLTSRATVLMTLDGNHVRIPNATVFKSIIVNYSRNPERRFDFTVGVGVETNLSEARQVAIDTLLSLDVVLEEPPPDAWIDSFGDSNMAVYVHGWMDQSRHSFPKVRGEAIRRVKRAFEEAGYDLPEPIYRIKMTEPADAGRAGSEPTTASRPRTGPEEDAGAADMARDRHLDREIAQERASTQDRDLLDADAPKE